MAHLGVIIMLFYFEAGRVLSPQEDVQQTAVNEIQHVLFEPI